MSKVAPLTRSRPILAPLLVSVASLALSGCIARTAAKIVTAPVNLASAAVDKATTSQSEADEKRGRDLRKREQRLGELEREYRRERQRCDNGNRSACARATELNEEIQDLIPTIPGEPGGG